MEFPDGKPPGRGNATECRPSIPVTGAGHLFRKFRNDNLLESRYRMNLSGRTSMEKYRCTICGYVYDPESGDPQNDIEPGIPFDDLPDDWRCPVCGVSKDDFTPM